MKKEYCNPMVRVHEMSTRHHLMVASANDETDNIEVGGMGGFDVKSEVSWSA